MTVRPEPLSKHAASHGFSMIEVMIVFLLFALIAAIAIPQILATLRTVRVTADARGIAGQLSLAKMRAASSFSQARLNCDVAANSCQVEVCTSKGLTTCNTFSAESGTTLLSTGVSFGFGTISTAAGTQSSIQNTTPILFNSRSLPVDGTSAITGNYALYLRDQFGNTSAVTVYASGRVAVWRYINNTWTVQ